MKPQLLCLLMAATEVLSASEAEEKPSMRAVLAQEIRRQVTYKPPAPSQPAPTAPSAPDPDVVVLEPFTVTTPSNAFAHKIDEQEQKVQAEKITFTNGGTIFSHEGKSVTFVLKAKYVPEHKGWDLLSLAW